MHFYILIFSFFILSTLKGHIELEEAVIRGKVDLLEKLIEKSNSQPSQESYEKAIIRGHTNTIKLLTQKYPHLKPSLYSINYAIKFNHDSLLNHLIDEIKIPILDEETLNRAIYQNKINLVLYNYAHFHIKPNQWLFDYSVAWGNLEMIKILVKKFNFRPSSWAFNDAVKRDYLDTVIFLKEIYPQLKPDTESINLAISKGSINVVKLFLHEKNISFHPSRDTIRNAIANEQIDMVDFLMQKYRIEISQELIDTLVIFGKSNIIKFLQTKLSIEPSNWAIDMAIERNFISILELFPEEIS